MSICAKRFTCSLMMILLATAACATDPDVKPDGATPWVLPFVAVGTTKTSLNLICAPIPPEKSTISLAQLVQNKNFDKTIFIGKAVQRKMRIKDAGRVYSNSCAVQFKVKEVLSGRLEDTVWVKMLYSHWVPRDEYLTYQHCYIQAGAEYLIVGDNIYKSGNPKKIPDYILAGKDVSKKPQYSCPPVEKLPEGNALVTEIKNILEKKQ